MSRQIDAQRPRPPELAHLPWRLPRQHPRPAEEVIRSRRYTLQEFFRESAPFSLPVIKKFLEREKEWALDRIPDNVQGNGGIRLFVWAGKLPTPEEHFNESAIRMPLLRSVPQIREFFLRNARPQLELPEGNRTHRCSICGSHMFGYMLNDHTPDNCVFKRLDPLEQMEFMSVNSIAFCNHCNARSTSHSACKEGTEKPCKDCDQWGHTTIQRLCGTDFVTDIQAQKDEVTLIRRKFYRRVRNLLETGEGLNYRLFVDYADPYLRKRRPDTVRGWGFYDDDKDEFPKMGLDLYRNSQYNRPAEYPGMVPVEVYASFQPPIPQFNEEDMRYLQELGRAIKELRSKPEREFSSVVLPTYRGKSADKVGTDRQRNRGAANSRGHRSTSRAPRSAVEVPSRGRSVSRVRGSQIQRPLCRPTDSYRETPKAGSGCSSSETVRAPGVSSGSQLAGTSTSNRTAIEARASSRNVTNASGQDRGFYTHSPPESVRPGNRRGRVDSSSGSAASYPSDADEPPGFVDDSEVHRRQTREADKLETLAEIRHVQYALMYCHEVLKVEHMAARASFQHKAFAILTSAPSPDARSAVIERIKGLQIILCGRCDSRPDIYDTVLMTDLRRYMDNLLYYGSVLAKENLLLVQLEEDSYETIRYKQVEGSDVVYLPSIDLALRPEVIRVMDFIMAPLEFGKPNPLDNFLKDVRPWFDIPEESCPDHMSEADQIREEKKLETDMIPQAVFGERTPVRSIELLDDYMSLPLPTAARALSRRIRWTVKMLSGNLPNEEINFIHSVDRLSNYLHLLRAAVGCVLELRHRNRVVTVLFSDCYEEIATSAARGHTLVLPKFRLHSMEHWERWVSYSNLCWDQLAIDLRACQQNTDCGCHVLDPLGLMFPQ